MIVLVRINGSDTISNPPLGLLYVGDALKKAGNEVRVYHVCEDDIHDYVSEIVKLNPIWVGLSVNTGWSISAALKISKEIKRHAPIPIVWGNVHPSILPEQCLAEDAIDYVVIGEGEITSVELTEAIVANAGYESIRGIGYKRVGGRIIINEKRKLIDDLDRHEMDWSLVDPERYVFTVPEFGMNRAFQYITSRGCPHNCGFCYNQRVNGRSWRAHSEQFVVERILALKKELNLDGIRFWDDNFFTNKKRAFYILEAIDMPYTAEIRVDYIDESFARRLDETGCKMVLLGLESGSDRVLSMINKGTTTERNMKALEVLNKYPRIAIHPSFIVGFPTETEAEFIETLTSFARMIRTRPNFWFVRLGMYVPYPGCEVYDLAVERGYHPPKKLEEWDKLIWDTSINKSTSCVDWLESKDDLTKDEQYLVLLHKMVQSRLPYGIMCDSIQKRIQHRYYKFELERYLFNMGRMLVESIYTLLNNLSLSAQKFT